MTYPEPERPKGPKYVLIFGIIALFFIGVISNVMPAIKSQNTMRQIAAKYNANYVCENAWEDDAHRVNDYHDQNVEYFDVQLHEGCWSGFVKYPRHWQVWGIQFMHAQPEDYLAFWWKGETYPMGPYSPNGIPELNSTPNECRVQGHGTLRRYRVVSQ